MPTLPHLTLTRLVLVLAAVVVGYLMFTAVGDTLLSHRLGEDQDRLHRDLTDLQYQQARLEAIRDYLKTDDYIEGVARRVLGMVRPGETLVTVDSNVTPTPVPEDATATGDDRPWWERLYGP